MYSLLLRPRAKKHLSKIPKKLQQKIVTSLHKLRENPFDHNLDIMKLAGTKRSYRLRVRELRVLYELDTKLRQIFVVDVDFRRTTTY